MTETEVNSAYTAKPPPPIKFYSDSDKSKTWNEWLQQYEWFKVSSGIDSFSPQRQAAILMNCLGADVMRTFNGFKLTEADMKDPTNIIAKFSETFTPTTNTTYNTYVFFNIAHKEDESFDEFFSRLRIVSRQQIDIGKSYKPVQS